MPFRFPFTKARVTKIQFVAGPSTLLTGLVSYWKLDEASGNRSDSFGGNTLTDNNTVTSASGKIGNAGSFAVANSEFLSHTDNSDLSAGDTDWTFAAWAQVASQDTFRIVASKGWGTGQAEWILYAFGGLWGFDVHDGTSQHGQVSPGSGTPSNGVWSFIVAWHDSVNNQLGVQVDNGTVGTSSHTTGVRDGTADFELGGNNAQSLYFDGLIDEAGWWRKVLSTSERTELYNSGNGKTYPFN